MSFTIRYNRTSVHIQGCEAATQTTGDDNGSGVVAYYAESACGSLTRNGYRMAVGESYETAAEARDAAQAKAKSLGLKFCKNCETAVKWAVANAPFDPESDEFKAEKKRVNDELVARSEAAKIKRAAVEQPERCIQRGAEGAAKSLPCTRERGHSGDCENARGERFTNWLDPNEKMYAFGSKPPKAEKYGMDSLRDMLKLY